MLQSIRHTRVRLSHVAAPRGEYLDEPTLRRFVPAIFADGAHYSRSERYQFTPTTDVLDAMSGQGLVCVSASVQGVRDLSRAGFQKHLLRFTHRDNLATPAAERLDVLSLNAHDGSAAAMVALGVFRVVCENGLISGDVSDMLKVTHGANGARDRIADAAARIADNFPRVSDAISRWKSIELSPSEYHAFGEAAADLRWDRDEQGRLPVNIPRLMAPRRSEDARRDLWTAYNVAQEALIRGGTATVSINPETRRVRHGRARPVNGIDQSTAINRALWTLTKQMAELKGAA